MGLSQLLGLELREEAGCRKGSGKVWMSLFHDLKLQQTLSPGTTHCPGSQPLRLEWPGPV